MTVALVTGAWMIENMRLFGVLMVPVAIVLVVYLDWRAKVLRASIGERKEQREAA